jgi:dTMP kinase
MEPNMNLRFITIEGGDGAGKSTYIPVIKQHLESLGHQVLLTREPGGTKLGETLRETALREPMSPLAETMLMFTARAEHVETVIRPALEKSIWVICDRFTDSTMAYQSFAKGVPESVIRSLTETVQGDLRPGLTFVFDVPLSISKARLMKTGKIPDKFESEDDIFFEKVQNGFKSIVKREPNRCKLIDSSRTIEETNEQVLILLNNHIEMVSYHDMKKKEKMKMR